MKFYCESGEKALEELASKKDGLSSAEAEKRLSENGKNGSESCIPAFREIVLKINELY